jgi:hypothetical protein
MEQFFAENAERIPNPIEYLWRSVKRQATHMRYFETFEALAQKVDENWPILPTCPSPFQA